MADEHQMLRHATRMAMITAVSRITGYVRDKALAWVLGAGLLNDAYRTAFRIPNAFRALLAEGALHAAFVPALAQLRGDDPEERRHAAELVRGLLAALMLALSLVVAAGVLFSPWLVLLYAEGFAGDAEKIATTVVMNRIMFPYLGFISLAALCQGILNSRDKFLLPAATPILLNLTVAGVAWLVLPRTESTAVVLASAVLLGGVLQLLVQVPAVRSLGFHLQPLWRAMTSKRVRQVLLLMLPGIPVLGINQINQLVTNRFASFVGPGAVTWTYHAYRVTELMFGGIVVQLTTVLLPVLSRELREDPDRAPSTMLRTVSLVSFVTLPTTTLLLIMARPIVGLLFGGGKFKPEDVAVTGAVLAAYALGLLGTGHAKVLASAFFAQKRTHPPMWGSALALVVFAATAWLLLAPMGAVALGWANSVAMLCYALFLSLLYMRLFGLGGTPVKPTLRAVCRQLAACAIIGTWLWQMRPWLADVQATTLLGAAKLAVILGPAAAVYMVLVTLMGGQEMAALLAALRRRSGS